jgi:hypothetical protein
LRRNSAFGRTANAAGGAVYTSKTITVLDSTISNNVAAGESPNIGIGGGLYARSAISLIESTISANGADFAAGIYTGNVASDADSTVINSTISGNNASTETGGIQSYYPLTISNSTIAFNSDGSDSAGGIYVYDSLTLQSSIIADNGPVDINGVGAVTITPDSSNNLIGASKIFIPAGTAQLGCPDLEPLSNNGGETRTHRPRAGSLALEHGGNPLNLTTDQRGLPRSAGTEVDIGALERQAGEQEDSIFFSGVDGFCSH